MVDLEDAAARALVERIHVNLGVFNAASYYLQRFWSEKMISKL